MSDTLLEKKPEELLIRKLNAFTEKVREDIEKNLISEADGQKLIAKAAIVVSMLTTT